MALVQLNSTTGPTTYEHLPGTPQSSNPMFHTPVSADSNNTYTMSRSPVREGRNAGDSYRPKIISTVGQRPACLVSASVTYVGNNEIYAFGGFDQYTDEVYNHVLRLNLDTRQWNLVDNYGDIPGVRMGHTATLWQGEKLLVFGGENEHRSYLCDVIIFDIKTAHWYQPEIRGSPPKGRARHSAAIHDEKLFIVGGLSGSDNNTILDEICYLDLRTWTWSRTWRFVPRFDHASWIWGGRLWVCGGMTEGMERVSEIWWLDLKESPTFDSQSAYGQTDRPASSLALRRTSFAQPNQTSGSGYAANSSSVQISQASRAISRKTPMAPGSISSVNFVSGTNVPRQAVGTHFHMYSSGCLLDFVTPAVTSSSETSLCALDLENMRWEKLADGKDLFNPSYRWHYCALNSEGTQAWLLGCPIESPTSNAAAGDYLSDVLPIDLRKLGLLGNNMTSEPKLPASDNPSSSHLSGIGADLARMFDKAPETHSSGADFIVTAEPDDVDLEEDTDDSQGTEDQQRHASKVSQPIYVHRLILEARWPHFARLIAAQMAEFHSRKLHIPEPYSAVRAFLRYLYTDSIAPHPEFGPTLDDVAGMLVLSNCYDMPRLRTLCRNRLGRELDVEHAAVIWLRAGLANEEWLKKRAAAFCFTHWGRVVRTRGFGSLRVASIHELCQEIDTEGRVVGVDELEAVGGLGGAKLGNANSRDGQNRRASSHVPSSMGDELDDGEDDEGMEIN